MSEIAHTPTPPYYAVIFTSLRQTGDHGYAEMAERMVALAAKQPGFLGWNPCATDLELPYPIGKVCKPLHNGKPTPNIRKHSGWAMKSGIAISACASPESSGNMAGNARIKREL